MAVVQDKYVRALNEGLGSFTRHLGKRTKPQSCLGSVYQSLAERQGSMHTVALSGTL